MEGAFFPSCVHCKWVSVSSSKPGNFLQDAFAVHTVVGMNLGTGYVSHASAYLATIMSNLIVFDFDWYGFKNSKCHTVFNFQ
jgi:hypothetical protein